MFRARRKTVEIMNHTPDVLISDELLEKILYCDFHSFSTCNTCEHGDECEQILNTDPGHIAFDLLNARTRITALEELNQDMLKALTDAYKIIRQHENPDYPGSAELRAIKTIIERATGRKIEEVI